MGFGAKEDLITVVHFNQRLLNWEGGLLGTP